MKILLYEPGARGHRPVILRYTIKVLARQGIEWEHESRDLRPDPEQLVLKAKATGCDTIHIMTLERLAWFTWRVSRLAHREGIRVIGTYYLFNNLQEGLKQWAWRALLSTGHIDTIFISDDALRDGLAVYPPQVKYLPDPWDPAEFAEWPQASARVQLGLPAQSVVILMFGLINENKGAEVLLTAIGQLRQRDSREEVLFLFAGQCSPSVKMKYDQLASQLPSWIKCRLIDRHIPEGEVSLYFHSADYVINAYPLSFKVSSGGVTRALAAGRPSLVPTHGVNGDLIKRAKCGLTFESGDVESLANTLMIAIEQRRVSDGQAWHEWCAQAKAAGTKRSIDTYAAHFLAGIGRPIAL